MTTAVGEMLKQVERLSAEEQLELTARLAERLEHQAEPAGNDNGLVESAEATQPARAEVAPSLSEDREDDRLLDVFSLNRVPPQRTYTKRVRYKYIGRLQPLPYPLEPEE